MVPVLEPRRTRPGTYLFFYLALAAILFLGHSAFFSLPFFWDELGQFVPAALDLYHDGSLVPHSAVPNVHPPGVMAWMAGVWKITGYSLAATRASMLALAALGATFVFLLAIQLSRGLSGAPAFFAMLLLLLDPLFYTQSMMAQLDMPAMVFTAAGLLFYLQGRHRSAALACTALVLAKETGVLLPLLCGATLLIDRGRERQAIYYVAPCLILTAWLGWLWHVTGHPFGDREFAHYNIAYALHPVRAALSILRRLYYLLVGDFRWVGSLAILYAWKRGIFSAPAWRFVALFAAGHTLLVSLLGGAELERYLMPVLPLFYIATAAAWSAIPLLWRNVSVLALTLGLLGSLFINPPYPFPFENNLAMADFVELHRQAALYLEQSHIAQPVYTAWPLTAALRRPEFGFVRHPMQTVETSDLHYSTLGRLDSTQVNVLVLYSRTWEPGWGVLRSAAIRKFLGHFYEYEPQMTAAQAHDRLGLRQIAKWTRRGQWIEVYTKEQASPTYQVSR